MRRTDGRDRTRAGTWGAGKDEREQYRARMREGLVETVGSLPNWTAADVDRLFEQAEEATAHIVDIDEWAEARHSFVMVQLLRSTEPDVSEAVERALDRGVANIAILAAVEDQTDGINWGGAVAAIDAL